MILDNITLYNFGLYRGFQTINLTPPSPDKPIVLFGGLNGGGKTTLLDAIQLALYGKLARCSNRNSLSYGDYLSRCIHSGYNPTREAAIILEFRHTIDGESASYRVQRKWSNDNRSVSDSVIINRNGAIDEVLAERWAEFVEDLLPSNIAHLFFFDGEKIEAFADPARSAELLQSAMHSLLGLDMVDRLNGDLLALERRKKEEALDSASKVQVGELAVEIEAIHKLNETTNEKFAKANRDIDNAAKALDRIEQTFRLEGGTLFEQRQQLESEHAHLKGALAQTTKELVAIAGQSDTPLLILTHLLTSLNDQHGIEKNQRDNDILLRLLADRDEWLLDRLRHLGAAEELTQQTTALLDSDRQGRVFQHTPQAFALLSKEATGLLLALLPFQANEARERLNDRLAKAQQLREELEQQDRRLGAIPESDNIHSLIEERQRLKTELNHMRQLRDALQEELKARSNAAERLEAERNKLLESVARDELKRLDAQRLLNFSERSRDTLKQFRENVLSHNINRIEAMILKSFNALMHKDNFVHDLNINPQTFDLMLRDGQGRLIEANRLSAGERQLLAVSMLWGLARASGRTLPIVIDTPLGRLDSQHRANLIERYFPTASEQVLLLSTDEEIDPHYYRQLAPSIGRTYHLDYDDAQAFTKVKPGYFWSEELAS